MKVTPKYVAIRQVKPHLWETLEEVHFNSNTASLVVPKEFLTDGASVPRIFWNIVPPMSNYTNAAVIHDWLYRTHHFKNRKYCDEIFLEAMEDLGVSKWRRLIMYRAVRVFGFGPWKRQEP